MKIRIFLLVILFSCSTPILAQVTQNSGSVLAKATSCGDIDALFTHSGASIHNLMYSEITASKTSSNALSTTKGSPYFVNSFEKSKIYHNGELVGSFYTRYNVHSQELEVKKTLLAEEQFKSLLKDENIMAVFDDKTIQYTSFIDDNGKLQKDYLISKTEGDQYRLHERLEVKYIEGKEAANSMVNAIPNRFTNSSSYYLEDVNTSLVSYLPRKRTKLLNLFKENEKIQLANLIKKNNLNLKTEKDLISLLNFANTIDQEDYTFRTK